MSDQLAVQLSPTLVKIQPGGPQQEIVLTVQNTSGDAQQYSIELQGLDAEWFTPPPPSIRLFDGDRETYRFLLRPTRRAARGSYAYRVLVSSRTGVQESAEGTLEIIGQPQYELRLPVLQQSGRGRGNFTVQVVNTGGVEINVVLEARAADTESEVRFGRDPTVRVAAGQTAQVPLAIRPKHQPLSGEERNYEFTVTSRPDDTSLPPRTVSGVFTYQPRVASWAPLRRAIFILLAVALGLTIVAAVIPAGVAGPAGVLRNVLCSVPIIDSLCEQKIPVAANCQFSDGFQAYAAAEPKLIGTCVTPPLDDGFGNVRQYTFNGVLFWHKRPNTVYFLKDDSLYAFVNDKSTLILGSGKS